MKILPTTKEEFKTLFGESSIEDGNYEYFKTDIGLGIRKCKDDSTVLTFGTLKEDPDIDVTSDYELLLAIADKFSKPVNCPSSWECEEKLESDEYHNRVFGRDLTLIKTIVIALVISATLAVSVMVAFGQTSEVTQSFFGAIYSIINQIKNLL